MNDQLKAQIRISAIRRFRGISVALALAVIFVIGAQVAQERIARNYGGATLARESAALTREYTRFESERGQELALLPPPTNAFRREIWARRIADKLDQPTAVCIIESPALMWLTKPHRFAISADSVSMMLSSPDAVPRSATLKKYGDTRCLHMNIQSGTDNHNVWLFSRDTDSLNWGVMLSSNDTWIAFFRNLEQSAVDDPQIGSPAWALSDLFALPKSTTQRWNMGVRAFLNDSLIFSSNDLDTTRPSYTYNFNGRRAQCYLSSWQETTTHWRIMRMAFWPILLLPLALFVVFYRNYRQIRALTEPDESPGSN